MTGENGWTEARVARLKKLWSAAWSASSIAKDLGGVTRSAVIGKAHRLGCEKRASPSKPGPAMRGHGKPYVPPTAKPAVRRPPKAGIPIAAAVVRRFEREADKAPINLRELAEAPHARPWMSRMIGECSWPIGEGADLLSCCAPNYRRGWCRDHFIIGTTTPKPIEKLGPAHLRTTRRAA